MEKLTGINLRDFQWPIYSSKVYQQIHETWESASFEATQQKKEILAPKEGDPKG